MRAKTPRGAARLLGCIVVTLCFAARPAAGQAGVVVNASNAEKRSYVHRLLPLPKEIALLGKTRVALRELRLVVGPDAAESVHAAAEELKQSLKENAGVDVPMVSAAAAAGEGFSVHLGLRASRTMEGLSRVPDMAGLPNAEQAYAIVPVYVSKDRVSGCALVGQGEPGAYYATKTLLQLWSAGLRAAGPGKEADLPVVSLRDWPDLEERGFWGSYSPGGVRHIPLLASRKFNYIETHVEGYEHGIAEDGTAKLFLEAELIRAARRHAVRIVPAITHLDFLPKAVFERHPEVRAVGKHARVREQQALCHAKPAAQKLLNEWACSLARTAGIEGISVWLSEERDCPRCCCAQCAQENWFVGEVRLILQAWQEAKKANPKLRLRILLTQGSYPDNDLVLKAVPPEVGITYYSGSHTYSVSREPMIYPLLRQFAQSGRWLGVCPQPLAVWKYNTPFPCPQLVQARAKEFVEAGLKNVFWRLHPIEWPYYPMNLDAAAEWSWNANGRSVSEFVEAWAVREGFQEPDKVVQWVEAIGPVAWDVHEGRFPENFGKVTRALGKGDLKLGKDALRGFPHADRFDHDWAACKRAAQLAQEIGSPTLIAQTQVLGGYVMLLKTMYQLSQRMEAQRGAGPANAEAVLNAFNTARQSLLDGLRQWYAAVQQARGAQPWRFDSTMKDLEDNCARVLGTLELRASKR